MIKCTCLPLFLLIILLSSWASLWAATFTAGPAAVKSGSNVTITFSVSGYIDVEVAVLDANDKIIRHLAAGVLGDNAPAPFAKSSLSQTLLWDGKGDYGDAVTTGGKVRVRLGLSIPTLDTSIAPGYPSSCNVTPKNIAAPDTYVVAPRSCMNIDTWDDISFNYSKYGLTLSANEDNGYSYFRIYGVGVVDNKYSLYWGEVNTSSIIRKMTEQKEVVEDMFFGSDSCVYVMPWGGDEQFVKRYNLSWSPVPFSGIGMNSIEMPAMSSPHFDSLHYGDVNGQVTRCLGLNGKIYYFCALPDFGYARLFVYGRDGNLERWGHIPFAKADGGSFVRVDRDENLYVALHGFPTTFAVPSVWASNNQKYLMGSILKIPLNQTLSTGACPGAFRDTMGLGVTMASCTASVSAFLPRNYFVPKATLVTAGISFIVNPYMDNHIRSEFDMDRFGRIVYPDAMHGSVTVIDNNGNLIASVAKQMNGVFLGRPLRARCSKDAYVIWDAHNSRIIQAKIAYSVSQTCAF